MTAMFPGSGVPHYDARNSLPDPATVNCDELWYSTSRCQPRFDPAAANAMLAEQINLINRGEITYDCNYLNQVELSVRYLIQRGLPRGGLLMEQQTSPFYYAVNLDPPATRYSDFMTLTLVPWMVDCGTQNRGYVRINVNGLGWVPLFRNDGQEVRAADLRAGIPFIASYYKGAFYYIGLCASQVPI